MAKPDAIKGPLRRCGGVRGRLLVLSGESPRCHGGLDRRYREALPRRGEFGRGRSTVRDRQLAGGALREGPGSTARSRSGGRSRTSSASTRRA
jgi:hypothetical protein